ncbi:MAG TPA: hypothetical protein VEA35_06635 [Ramlibacter sp.]|nr:hypothetical protein [Ramlibacter sp.]
MKLVKTEAGQRVLKDRSISLTPRQRAAFILCDARHTLDHVLAVTKAVGVTREDIQHLLDLGLIAERPDEQEQAAAQAAQALHDRDPQQRYQDVYPIATRLTASLGLKGFRLNLAVEHALNLEQLRELAPRIREAVGDEAFAPLDRALNA